MEWNRNVNSCKASPGPGCVKNNGEENSAENPFNLEQVFSSSGSVAFAVAVGVARPECRIAFCYLAMEGEGARKIVKRM